MSEVSPHSINMVKHILRFRQVNKDIFEDIKKGRKTVETRAATSRFKNITSGDAVVFICGKEKFEKTVKRSQIFKSIVSMLSQYKIKDIMPRLSTEEELKKAYYSYPKYKEKIKKFGLVALEFNE